MTEHQQIAAVLNRGGIIDITTRGSQRERSAVDWPCDPSAANWSILPIAESFEVLPEEG